MQRNDKPMKIKALNESIEMWYARANGILISRKCPICKTMEKIATDPNDPCLNCPISQYNNNEGCPNLILDYINVKESEEAKVKARQIAEYLEKVGSSILGTKA